MQPPPHPQQFLRSTHWVDCPQALNHWGPTTVRNLEKVPVTRIRIKGEICHLDSPDHRESKIQARLLPSTCCVPGVLIERGLFFLFYHLNTHVA